MTCRGVDRVTELVGPDPLAFDPANPGAEDAPHGVAAIPVGANQRQDLRLRREAESPPGCLEPGGVDGQNERTIEIRDLLRIEPGEPTLIDVGEQKTAGFLIRGAPFAGGEENVEGRDVHPRMVAEAVDGLLCVLASDDETGNDADPGEPTPMEPYELATPVIDPTAYVAPGVQIFGDVHVGPNAVIMFGTVIRAELASVHIGRDSNIQDNCVIHTDEGLPSVIGSRVTVGHAAIVHGAVIGDHCLVGIGSMALNGSDLGEGSWLAAGSVLTEGKSIPAGMLAVGTPARALRELTPDEVRRQDEGVDVYLRLAATYRTIAP